MNLTSFTVSCQNDKLELKLLGEMSTASDMQMIQLQWQKVKRNSRAF